MSVYIIDPGITDDLVINAFVRLCSAEVKKKIGFQPDHEEGLQDGYVYCLIDFFGESSDAANSKNYDQGKSYLHMIVRIVNEEPITRLVDELLRKEGVLEIEDIVSIDKIVKRTVREFFVQHPDDMRSAIENL